MEQLELNAVVQRYGATTIVDGVDFKLATGQIACLLGPSGCGKTTLLRCIAGFEEIAGGEIRLHGDVVSRKGQRLAPEKRRIGMVDDGLETGHILETVAMAQQPLIFGRNSAELHGLAEFVTLPAIAGSLMSPNLMGNYPTIPGKGSPAGPPLEAISPEGPTVSQAAPDCARNSPAAACLSIEIVLRLPAAIASGASTVTDCQ